MDLEGVEPSSEQLILRHAKILFVNVLMISQNIRFKAILSHSDAFSIFLWVADPLKHIKRLETTFYKPYFYIIHCPITDSKALNRMYSHS